MQIEPQPLTPANAMPEPIVPPEKKLIAPIWHTVLVAIIILANSYAGSKGLSKMTSHGQRLWLYGGSFILQFALFLLIWFGISRKHVKMRELIGGRWSSPEDFLIDVAIATGFWLVSTFLRAALMIGLHIIDLKHPEIYANEMKRAVAPLLPQSSVELVSFLCLTIPVGFFEEIIFRGYFQRQFGAMLGNIWLGVLVSAALFGAAHGYQGTRLMLVIGMYGAMFGVLAALRKSLRPGMIAHAGQDAFSSILYFFATRKGVF